MDLNAEQRGHDLGHWRRGGNSVGRRRVNLRIKVVAVSRTKEGESAYLTRVRAKSRATREQVGSLLFGE
jgi:hypothetical protein